MTLVQAEKDHRVHAIIEHVHADLRSGPLAHFPSGSFGANSAWLVLAAIAFNLTRAAGALTSTFHARATRRALEGIGCQHLTVARVAEGLGVAWNTANDAVLAEGRRVLITDSPSFDGVRVLAVDEHVWRRTRRGNKYVIVIIDLPGIRDGTGPARRLDMVEAVRSRRSRLGSPRLHSAHFRRPVQQKGYLD